MKFHEVILDMTPGDVFKTDREEFKMNRTGSFKCNEKDLILTKGMMHFEGQIILSEPKVLSAAEYLNNLQVVDEQDFSEEIMDAFSNGDQNGQLKMYLQFKKAFEKNQNDGNFETFGFSQALKNLKP